MDKELKTFLENQGLRSDSVDYYLSTQSFTKVEGSDNKFKHLLLPEGELFHPLTGKKQEHPIEELFAFAKYTNEFIADTGQRRPFPDGHTTSSVDNLGYWDNFKVETGPDGKNWLSAEVEVPDDGIVKKIGKTIKGISVWIQRNVLSSTGKTYPALVLHAAATEYGVVPNQGNFQKLSMFSGRVSLKEEEPDMKLTETLAAILAVTAEDAAVVKAVGDLKAKLDGLEKVDSQLSIITTELGTVKENLQKREKEIVDAKKVHVEEKLTALKAEVLEKTKAPISAEEVTFLEELLAEGKDAQVKVVVDGLLSRVPSLSGNEHTTSPTADGEKANKIEQVAAIAKVLTDKGDTVVIADDKLSYVITERGEGKGSRVL